ncbi:MAG: hypothetical protein E7415_02395 [Ruminococcaceae bacterium]|nr:hypothetical protein [Oscillospiraceae bacterium]
MKKTGIMSMLLSMVLLFTNTVVFTTPAMAAEESYALSITNKPGTTFVLSQGEYTSDVCDLWNEIDSDGTGELKFDQSFSININDAVEVYNNFIDTQYPDGDREHYKALEDNNNGAIFYVQARVLINDYEYQFSSKASYMYAPYGLDGEYNEGCGEWNISSYYDDLCDFFTMSKDGGVLNLSLDGTVKEIYEALKAQDETLGDVTVNDLTFKLRVSCEVEYIGSWGSTNYTELSFEAISHSLYDKHIYESASEYDNLSVVPVTAPLTVNVVPAYEGCYEPVNTEYSWYYEFIKEGEEEEEDGGYKWYGYFEKDETKESDVLTETAPSGTIYGIAYGKVDSDSNSITIDDILNEDNKDFINSFIGEKPRELGGKGQMFIGCDVTLTFEDGKQWVVYITKADYMSRLIIPCMHACSVCGLCTETEKMLSCNFDTNMWMNINCECEEPVAEVVETEIIENISVDTDNSMIYCEPTVVVEKINLEASLNTKYIKHITKGLVSDKAVMMFNIDLFDGDTPYQLNQWGGNEEYLTITIPVGSDNAQAIKNGEISVYHIGNNGNPEFVNIDLENGVDVEKGTITFASSSFSPFILVEFSEETAVEAIYNEADNTCTAQITLTAEDLGKVPVIYVAFYNNEGVLTQVKQKNVVTSADKYTLYIPDDSTNCKVMVWTSALTPICNISSCEY